MRNRGRPGSFTITSEPDAVLRFTQLLSAYLMFQCYESNENVLSEVYDADGNALTIGQVVNQLNVYHQRALDAESVINSINVLRDRAHEEVKAERDRCVKGLQDIKRHCGAKLINADTSTLGGFVDMILSGCPNVR